ncbi:MAG: hypothetical protein WED04_06140 [Promethearchaeati archaeon SRVP18_Atabeyarchaeia-1]
MTSNSDGKGTFAQQTAEASRVEKEMGESTTGAQTTEEIFAKVMNVLNEMGFRNLSVERSEDFTGRIDAIFTRQTGLGEKGSSGYLRILSVCRVGGEIHVELCNFLREFSSDDLEMSEIRNSLEKLFGSNKHLKMDIHE